MPEGTLQEANSHTRLNRVDSNRTYSSQEAITVTISNLEYLKAFTNNIKELLGVGNISTNIVSSSEVDITIIIGKDYNK